MRLKTLISSLVMVFVYAGLLIPAMAQADDKAEAVKMVKEAAAFHKANGLEKTLDVLNDPKGQFVKGDLYVFAYGFDGTMMANVVKPNLVGQNVLDVPDAVGKKFRREIVEKAKKDKLGWVDYKTIHPKTKQNEEKSSYCENAGDEIIICCGVYK
ncbi:MAG TPA: cache domain-containing protein [Desulfuromonadaceae bacterium]|jgi:methyl-accepting chemotaxis protein